MFLFGKTILVLCLTILLGFLQVDNGTVLKPILEKKGQREVAVYRAISSSNCKDEVLCGLREFVPKFIGLWTTPAHPGRSCLNDNFALFS